MKRKVLLLIIVALIIILSSTLFIFYGRNDANLVLKIPSGFVDLKSNLKNGISYMGFETQIVILDADGVGIYNTSFKNSDFIVKYKGDYYVDEKELLKIATSAGTVAKQRNKLYRLEEEVIFRSGDSNYRGGYCIKINEVKKQIDSDTVYIIKFTINPLTPDLEMGKYFHHIETDMGTIIKEFSFIGEEEVRVTVPAGEKINMIIVRSPDNSGAIRKISVA